MNNKHKSNKGLTLVELIIAVAVLSVGLLSLYLVVIYGIKINRQAKILSLSYEIANKEMETIRNTPFANLINQTNGNFLSDSASDIAKLNAGNGLLTIRNYDGTSTIKEIIIKVNWTDNGESKTTTLTTLSTSGGISP